MNSYPKSIALVVNLFGEIDYESLKRIAENLRRARCRNADYLTRVIISWSNPPTNASELVKKLRNLLDGGYTSFMYLPLPKMGSGKHRDLTLQYILRKYNETKYIVYIEEDVIVYDSCWLDHLVEMSEKLPFRIAILSPEPATKLCLNLVGRIIPSKRMFVVGLVGGFGLYLVRSDALKHLMSKGLRTYSPYMYFYWEDKEFTFKLWLESFVTLSYKGINYVHLGDTSKTYSLHRRYTKIHWTFNEYAH